MVIIFIMISKYIIQMEQLVNVKKGTQKYSRLLMKIHLHMKILYNLEIFHVQNLLYLKNI